MTPQLIGTKKSADTRKVERFLKERGIDFQFRDLSEKGLSPKELDDAASAAGGHDALVDQESKQFKKRNMAYMAYDAREELIDDPLLLRQPIVRCDRGVAVQPGESRLQELFG